MGAAVMKRSIVTLTRQEWTSIPDAGSELPEASRWIDSEALEAAIASLPPPFAEVIRLRRQSLAYEEIARRVGVSVSAVAARTFRAYRLLRAILRDRLPPDMRG
jgi:DNA-directed RNA polymerase specialized sigma24 family protein